MKKRSRVLFSVYFHVPDSKIGEVINVKCMSVVSM